MDDSLKKIVDLVDHLDLTDGDNLPDFDDKVMALAIFLGIDDDYDEILNIDNRYDDYYGYGNKEYLVLTDYEADCRLEEYLKDVLDNIIYTQIPESLHCYFNEEAWIKDLTQNGRGHCLALYDGYENEECYDNEWYYIYRTN